MGRPRRAGHRDRGEHSHDGHSHDGHRAHGAPGHAHAPAAFGPTFAVAIGLNALIVVVEATFGVIGHSVALLSDAAHNSSDVLGLVAAYAASLLGRRAPSGRFTYGLGGSSILAALFNAVTLLVVTGALILEAIQRLFHPAPVATTLVMATAGAAILANGVSAWLLARGQGDDLNLRAAVAHLAADAGVAVSVVVVTMLIAVTGVALIDPLLSLVINAAIVVATWGLLRESVTLSLAGVPGTIDGDAVRQRLANLPGVSGLHDLHIWPMSTSETALTAHLVMPQGHPGDGFLMEVSRILVSDHAIGHVTLQIETERETACTLAPDGVV